MSGWWKKLAMESRVQATAHADPSRVTIEALEHAANQAARFVGVICSPRDEWNAFPMTSDAQLSEWYGDWIGTPALYAYLGMFDKESEAWSRGNAVASAVPDAHGGRIELVGAWESQHATTLPEITRLLHDQDFRWASIVDKARRAKNPIAPVAVRFFKNTWEPMLRQYMLGIGSLNPIQAPRAIDEVLTHMHAIYTIARTIGFPESSFLLPDIELDDDSHSRLAAQDFYDSHSRLSAQGRYL